MTVGYSRYQSICDIMEKVLYAMREDSATIILLEDGGTNFDKCQIAIFRHGLIKPKYLQNPMALCTFDAKYSGHATDVENKIFDDRIKVKNNYVVKIDSQVEFNVDYRTLGVLQKDYMPAKDAEAYSRYFSEYSTGILVFCRIYKISTDINPRLFDKGKNGNSAIIALYNDKEEFASVDIDDLTPVLTDNQFGYIKDEIIHKLKFEGSFITIYDNNEKGRNDIIRKINADNKLKRSGIVYNENTEIDRARVNYEDVYAEVIRISPGMSIIINRIREIETMKYGEISYLLGLRNSEESEQAKNRLFDLHLKATVRTALLYYKKFKNYGAKLDDTFQNACLGLLQAIDSYTDDIEGSFGSYAATWVRQAILRYTEVYQYNVRLPANYVLKIMNIADVMYKELGDEMSMLNWHEMLEDIQLCSDDMTEKEAKEMRAVLTPAESFEEIIEGDKEDYDSGINLEEQVVEDVYNSNVHKLMKLLNEREKFVIELRYVYEKTLEQVGNRLGITRERIRQIEDKAIRKLKYNAKKYGLSRERKKLTKAEKESTAKKS